MSLAFRSQRLAPEPEDYMLDHYHFNNEVYGDGEIGVNISNLRSI